MKSFPAGAPPDFRAAFHQAPVALSIIDADGRPIESNSALEEMLGYSRTELREIALPALAHPDDIASEWDHFVALRRGEVDRYGVEMRYVRKDGGILRTRLHVARLRNPDDADLAIAMVEDITGQSSNWEAAGGLAGVAHDLSNLLTVIGGFAELLRSRLLPGHPGHEEVAEILTAAARAARLLECGTPRGIPPPGCLATNASAAGAEPRVAETAQPETHATIETVLLVDDEGGIRRMARQMLERNGYRVIEAGSGREALAAAERHEGAIHLLLTDVVMPEMSGPALSEALSEARPNIKVLYMSGYTDDTRVRHGVEHSQVAFLRKPFTEANLMGAIRKLPGEDSRRATILVVDDESAVRHSLAVMLESAGHTVLEAGHGREALDLLARQNVDLVLTDLMMPEQEGLEMIRTVRREYPQVRIIAISGAFGGGFLKTAELLGAHASLPKPVSLEALSAAVTKMLRT